MSTAQDILDKYGSVPQSKEYIKALFEAYELHYDFGIDNDKDITTIYFADQSVLEFSAGGEIKLIEKGEQR